MRYIITMLYIYSLKFRLELTHVECVKSYIDNSYYLTKVKNHARSVTIGEWVSEMQ